MCDHIREHNSILVAPEKRILTWTALRLPRWVNSDHLTLLGVAGMLLGGLAYWGARWEPRSLWIVAIALGINWFGDSMDGTLARVRNRQRPRYGFYVDHVVDVVGALFLLGGLSASGYITPWIGLGLLIGFLLLAAESYLATYALGIFRLSFMGIGATELRILLAAGTLYLLIQPQIEIDGLGSVLLFDVAGVCAIAAMAVTLSVSTIRNTRALYRAEPLPPDEMRRGK